MAEQQIGQSLVVVALYHFELWQRGIKKIQQPGQANAGTPTS